MIRPASLPHLVRRFFVTLLARVDPVGIATVDRVLSPAERDLFLTMNESDQRHSIDLCERLWSDGHAEPDLLRAALLHDVGKASGSLPILYRVAFTLAVMASPRLARWLARPGLTVWRQPFCVAAHHPEIGAIAATQAGSSPRVVGLILNHNQPGADSLSRLLYAYDRRM